MVPPVQVGPRVKRGPEREQEREKGEQMNQEQATPYSRRRPREVLGDVLELQSLRVVKVA